VAVKSPAEIYIRNAPKKRSHVLALVTLGAKFTGVTPGELSTSRKIRISGLRQYWWKVTAKKQLAPRFSLGCVATTRNRPNSAGKLFHSAIVFIGRRHAMLATRFDDVFLVPVRSRRVRTSRSQDPTADDLEFSNFARSPRQSIAWVFLVAACFWAVVAGLAVLAT
jgi:hypothetical protein